MYANTPRELYLDKILKASVASLDIMSCAQDVSQPTSDNRWAYISFMLGNEAMQHGIGPVQYFVRASVDCHGEALFDDVACAPEDLQPPKDNKGAYIPVQPVRFAVVKLWLAEVCDEGTIGCHTYVDVVTGQLPVLFRTDNLVEGDDMRLQAG